MMTEIVVAPDVLESMISVYTQKMNLFYWWKRFLLILSGFFCVALSLCSIKGWYEWAVPFGSLASTFALSSIILGQIAKKTCVSAIKALEQMEIALDEIKQTLSDMPDKARWN